MKSTKTVDTRPPKSSPSENFDWEDTDDDADSVEDVDDSVIPLKLSANEGREKLVVRRRIEQYWEERHLRELLGDYLDE